MSLTVSENRIKKRGAVIRALCLLLCLIIPLPAGGLIMAAAQSASSQDAANDYQSRFAGQTVDTVAQDTDYFLYVGTGNSAGDCVSCFEIRYKSGDDGKTYSEFIEPDICAGSGSKYGVNAFTSVKDNNLGIKSELISEQTIYDRTSIYSARSANKLPLKTDGLKKNSYDGYYFSSSHPIDELVDIRAHCSYTSGGNNTWAFRELVLYRLSRNRGTVFVGSIAEENELAFDGELIAVSTGTGNCTVSGKSEMFTFAGNKNGTKFNLSDKFTDGTSSSYADSNNIIIEMDVADIANAALDYFELGRVSETRSDAAVYLPSLRALRWEEALKLEILYNDRAGQQHTVMVPFITSAITEMKSALDGAVPKLLGLFQQGDTVACSAYLPELATVTKCRLTLTNKASEFPALDCSLSSSFMFSTIKQNSPYLVSDNQFSVSALRIYSGEKYGLSYRYNGATLQPVITGGPDPLPSYCWVASSYTGTTLKLNSSAASMNMTRYSKGIRTKAPVGSTVYLVAITTDANVTDAGTTDDVFMTLNYTKSNGTENETVEYSLREQSDNFYGNWCCRNSLIAQPMKSTGYYYNMQPGKTLYFTINLSDVISFTGATLRLESGDEWQMSDFSIYQLASLGERRAEWGSHELIGKQWQTNARQKFTTDREITREFDGIQCVRFSEGVLLQVNDKKTISFSQGTVDTKDISWGDYTYYMSYEDTKQDFGFTKIRYTYDVAVKVGDDVEGDNDCGSKNEFYFQLVFSNGKSAYVLANQQLSADGFRSGREEHFDISVNRDYGDLRAVHIIPQNSDDSDKNFDKLKIDYINVSKKSTGGINVSWKIEINDWISIDYNDSGAQDSVKGQSGKNEGEIARSFVVTGTGYTTNILVAVTTDKYDNSVQFSGHIGADIRYRDSNGVEQTLSDIDVTNLMYQYAGKSAGSKMTVDGVSMPVNDKAFMMREYHTDRFMISINDVKQIESIRFKVYSNEIGTWTIKAVNMYLVESSGQRTINANQEYELAGTKKPLTCSDDSDTFSVAFKNAYTYSTEIQLADNNISVKDTGGTVAAAVDYVPQNKDDTMNVYVYMAANSTPVDKYDMKCSVNYSVNLAQSGGDEIVDKIYKKPVRLTADKADNVYYATGVTASGLVNVCSVSLQADSYSFVTSTVDRVVIEHVRSGVAIEKYTIPMYGASAYPIDVTAVPTGSVSSSEYRQTVEFMLTDETVPALLGYKTDDIAVAITYTSLSGATTHRLTSPNVFVSESDTSIIRGGTVCTVNFNQSDVSEITGIQFIASGRIVGNAGIKNAYAANYFVDSTGKETCLGWYSFGYGIDSLSAGARTLSQTSSSSEETDSLDGIPVSPVTVTVKTADAAQASESGTSSPVRMTVNYYDANNNERAAVFDDINSYIINGSTATGKTLTAKVLINNLASVRSIEFEPYEPQFGKDLATWAIENVSLLYTVNGNETELSRTVNTSASEGQPVAVNLSSVAMSVNAFSYNKSTNVSYNKVFTGTGEAYEGILIDGLGEVTFTPSVSGSIDGVSVKCYRLEGGVPVPEQDKLTVQGTSTRVRSVIFGGNEKLASGQYRIVFTSNEFRDVELSITVVVSNPEGEEPEKTTVEEKSKAEDKETTTAVTP